MAIYTRLGDRGKTSLFGGKSGTRKDSSRVTSLGTIDELNCQFGFVVSLISRHKGVRDIIIRIQQDLFEIAAEIGTPPRVKPPFILTPSRVLALEKIIDELEGSLPALGNFIFPGGSTAGASLHVARSVCRRAERDVVHLARKEKINPEILRYLNRLSDCLFMLAREVNRLEGKKENVWKGK